MRLVVRLKSAVAKHLEETPLSQDQRTTADKDDWVRIEATVKDSHQLRWWLLVFGSQIVVQSPDKLKNSIKNILCNSLRNYNV